MSSVLSPDTPRDFARLFAGYPNAFGTGAGGWVHKPPGLDEYTAHVMGRGTGLGIGPLLPDGNCWFAAIDLDRPDFELAQEMMKLLPGTSWLERSRSGNAHVLVFFTSPIEGWVARGIMLEVLAALGLRDVEVFPKTDRLLPGMVGNYLNLPYFGDARPVVAQRLLNYKEDWIIVEHECTLEKFVTDALARRNDPEDWRKRARWLGVPSPEERERTRSQTFGTTPTLHLCGQHVIEHRDDNPVISGHRAVVYFSLAKMLANWSEIDDDEALAMLALVNDSSPDPISAEELGRIYQNAKRREYTSTGCDDPLFLPYRHPDCKIGV